MTHISPYLTLPLRALPMALADYCANGEQTPQRLAVVARLVCDMSSLTRHTIYSMFISRLPSSGRR